MGIDCPDGEEFLLPWWAEAMSPKHNDSSDFKIKTIDQADEYIKCNFGYPVYCKPVSGSKGNDVFLIQSEEELIETAEQYNQKQIRVAMIEKPIIMPDYRVVVLDGELVSAYQRKPLSVIGNGFNSIRELIEQKQEEFVKQGRDTKLTSEDQRIHSFLKNKGLTLDHIVKEGSDMPLMAVSNLSAGGSSFDVTKSLHNRWSVLAHDISKGFNLRLAGIDLACTDITSPNSNYSILEVNAYPGLRHYASSGAEQAKIVKDFYAKVLNAYPHL
jgi:D-alanine-D-alanine ligase-like ATP-grasp enzyme